MKKIHSFTLIEILIAITVFSVGILAVLRVMIGNLSMLDDSNIKLQSTIFAKEGLELLYNIRDSNIEKGLPRNCIINQDIYGLSTQELNEKFGGDLYIENNICTGYFGENGTILGLSFDTDSYIIQTFSKKNDNFDMIFQENQLCMYSGGDMARFTYCNKKNGGEPTFYARFLSFSRINISKNQGISYDIKDNNNLSKKSIISYSNELPGDEILKVESHVLYKKGHKTGEIVFESFIGNH